MAWGDPSSYWFMRPREYRESAMSEGTRASAAAAIASANDRRQQMQLEIQRENQRLDAQRTGIQLAEYFNKKQLQNQTLAGNAKLAAIGSKYSGDYTNPKYMEEVLQLGVDNPQILGQDFYKGAVQLFKDATTQKNDLTKFQEGWDYRQALAREQMEGRKDIAERSNQTKYDIASMTVEARKEAAAKAQANIERRLGLMEKSELNRDEVARERLKLQKLAGEENQFFKLTKLLQDEERLGLRHDELDLRNKRFKADMEKVPAERLIQYRSEIKSVYDKYDEGGFLADDANQYAPNQKQINAALEKRDAAIRKVNGEFLGAKGEAKGGDVLGTRAKPYPIQSPDDAKKYKAGEFVVTPDGRVIELK